MGLSKEELIKIAKKGGTINWKLKIPLREQDAMALEVLSFIQERRGDKTTTRFTLEILEDAMWWLKTLTGEDMVRNTQEEDN